jgi:thioredoxin-related protein
MNKFLIALSLLAAMTVLAGNPSNLRSASALTSQLGKDSFSADLKPGFHFNDKAPNQILIDGQGMKASELQARHIRFPLTSAKSKNVSATLYVCDDELTFCETHHLDLKGQNNEKALTAGNTLVKTNKLGFQEGHLDQALVKAQKNKQLVLIDFTARWCPGCVRFKNEVFPTNEFKNLTKNVVKVEMDVDLFENFSVDQKFDIPGIPTLVVVNAEGQEIDRIVGFESFSRIASFMQAIQKNPVSIDQLMQTPASADNQTQLQVGQRLLDSGKAAESIAFLSRVQPQPPELLAARVTAAQDAHKKDAKNKEAYIKELKDALKTEPGSTRSIDWRTQLVHLLDGKSPEVQSLLAEGKKLSDELLQDEAKLKVAVATDQPGEFKGYEKWVVAMYKADLVEAAGAPAEEVKKVYSEAADIGQTYHIPISKPGPALRQLVILSAAERWPEAETQVNLLLKADPQNTDLKRRKMKILMGLNKYDQAVKLGEEIIDQAVGRNQFWVAESLAKAYMKNNQKDSAKKIVIAYLARPEIETDKMKSSKKNFEELLKTIQ